MVTTLRKYTSRLIVEKMMVWLTGIFVCQVLIGLSKYVMKGLKEYDPNWL